MWCLVGKSGKVGLFVAVLWRLHWVPGSGKGTWGTNDYWCSKACARGGREGWSRKGTEYGVPESGPHARQALDEALLCVSLRMLYHSRRA